MHTSLMIDYQHAMQLVNYDCQIRSGVLSASVTWKENQDSYQGKDKTRHTTYRWVLVMISYKIHSHPTKLITFKVHV
jgi:hypothetical protein